VRQRAGEGGRRSRRELEMFKWNVGREVAGQLGGWLEAIYWFLRS
jgi:hypothetical protein